MNRGCQVQDQLSTNEPTAPYIIGRELNLRKLPGRQWESNPQPYEQLRPMTIKTSASTETATTAYIEWAKANVSTLLDLTKVNVSTPLEWAKVNVSTTIEWAKVNVSTHLE